MLTSTIAWVLEFLSNRPQYVFLNENSSNVLVTNTCTPQGCVISPVLFTLYTNYCRSEIASINPILKFAAFPRYRHPGTN